MYVIPEKLKSPALSTNEKDEIRRKIREYRSVGDVVSYVLALRKKDKLTADDENIHHAFHKLKEDHPQLLKEMAFTRGDLFPFSNELQTALFNLQSSGAMEAINPVYEFYRIPKKMREGIKSYLSNSFSESEKEELGRMSVELEALLSSIRS